MNIYSKKIIMRINLNLLSKIIKLEVDMKDINLKIWDMGVGSFFIKMEGCMMDNGFITKWMAKGHCIIKVENLHMMGIGKMINLKGGVDLIMNHHRY
jgi:hypothetical protein